MRRHLPVLVLALLPAALAAQSGSAPRRLEVPYRQFQLANGLNVILHRDTSVPIVTVNVWYHVGSANERPGRSLAEPTWYQTLTVTIGTLVSRCRITLSPLASWNCR